ncbi:unnamed protein product [Heterosigma akashiwo]
MQGQPRQYAQIYILDAQAAEQATHHRMHHPVTRSCNPDHLNWLQQTLADVNPYASDYRMMHEVATEEKARLKQKELLLEKSEWCFRRRDVRSLLRSAGTAGRLSGVKWLRSLLPTTVNHCLHTTVM